MNGKNCWQKDIGRQDGRRRLTGARARLLRDEDDRIAKDKRGRKHMAGIQQMEMAEAQTMRVRELREIQGNDLGEEAEDGGWRCISWSYSEICGRNHCQ